MIDEEYCRQIRQRLTQPCLDHGKKGNKFGYHLQYSHMEKGKQKRVLLHRKVYCETNGIALSGIDGKVVMHLCDNPRCIEPTHLALGTNSENMLDAKKKGRLGGRHKKTNPQKYLYREWDKYDDKEYVN